MAEVIDLFTRRRVHVDAHPSTPPLSRSCLFCEAPAGRTCTSAAGEPRKPHAVRHRPVEW